jgi:peroxiredoxin Q/BCP
MNFKIGDTLTPFEGKDQNEQTHTFPLSQATILFFYPKDNTPGCTAEACSLRDEYEVFKNKGYTIVGVSTDSGKSHLKFIDNYQLPFTLLSDTEKTIVNHFGVWGKKKFMGKEYEGIFRTTFVINETGVITHIIDKVDTKNAAKQLLDIIG